MQSEPPNADPPKCKRPWFQFSLRTLLIGVTLLAVPLGYVGWQAKILKARRAWRAAHPFTMFMYDEYPVVAWGLKG